ncbi:hypothetical protein AABB24_023548 [Solanum stoloniferum]|uniref:Uncharacterized protein n=1 Tax=Solanum stoloniferum TaxID=62892 RepID=A0ABD2SJW6_9SOLN
MYSRTSGTQHKFKKGYNLVCDFFKINGQTRETYFKIIGYPHDFMFKKRGVNNFAYNVTSESDDGVRSSASTISNDAGGGHTRCDTEAKKSQNQLDSCTLTREQYTQILHLLDKKSKVPHCVNVAGAFQREGEVDWLREWRIVHSIQQYR